MLTWASVLSPEPAASHLLDYTLVVNANNDTLAGTRRICVRARPRRLLDLTPSACLWISCYSYVTTES